MTGKKKPRHPKTRLARGVVLEQRRTIGFHRQPVQDPWVKPVVHDLPLSHFTDLD